MLQSQRKKFIQKYLIRFFPVVFIAVSSFLFYRALGETSFLQITASIRDMSLLQLGSSTLLSALSFILLGFAEILAFHSLHEKSVPRSQILKVSFLAFGIGNTLPMGGIAASTVRFRHYSHHDLGAEKILRIISFSSIGGWLGFIFLAGIMSLAIDFLPVHNLPLSIWTMRSLGVCFVGIIALYLFLSLKQTNYTFLKVKLKAPRLKVSMTQILIAMTDWIIVGIALFVLLPSQYDLHFQEFFLVFLFSQILGIVVHVPGGIGILEFLFVSILLSGQPISSELMASFLVFRLIYYIIPFAISLAYFAWSEVSSSDSIVFQAAHQTKRIIFSFAPQAAALLVTLAGIMLLISGGSETTPIRLHLIAGFIPRSIISFSNFAASITGVALLVLANSLRKRSSSSWLMTLMLIAAGAVFSIFKGVPNEEVFVLLLFAAGLFLTKDEFFRKSSLTYDSLSMPWIFSVGAIVLFVSTFVFINFSFALNHNLAWWNLNTNLGPTQSASFGAIVFIALIALWRLLSPPPKTKAMRREIKLCEVAPIVTESQTTLASLAFTGDKTIFFAKLQKAFIMHAIQGQSWVSMGNPIGEKNSFENLIRDFMRTADTYGGWPVFYQITPEFIPLYIDLGFRVIKIGEEATVDLRSFSLEGRERKTMRNTLSRIEREGYEFSIVLKEQFHSISSVLKTISEEWLSRNKAKEKGFSLGFFDLNYLEKFDTAVLKKDGVIVGFANIWKSGYQTELSIDLMRTSSGAPSGAMEYIIIQLMLWGQRQGFQSFNLGMAPLAGLDKAGTARSWQNIGNIMYDFGEYFYNFKGIKTFKDKFSPDWQSRYIAFPQGASLTAVMADIARLISQSGRNKHVFEPQLISTEKIENEKTAA